MVNEDCSKAFQCIKIKSDLDGKRVGNVSETGINDLGSGEVKEGIGFDIPDETRLISQ